MKYCFLFCFMLFSICFFGLSPHLSPNQTLQRFWSTKDGLPQTSVTDLIFDREGYLWVSTFGGVARFNGRKFDYLDVPDPRVTKLFFDEKNNLWMGTENGFIFKKEGRKILKFSLPERKSVVRDLVIDKNGVLYVASDNGFWILRDGKWEFFDDFVVPKCTSILVSHQEVYIGTKKGLYVLKDGILKKEGKYLENQSINKVKRDYKGNLWVATANGIYIKEGEKWKVYLFKEKYYSQNYMDEIYEDRNGFIWYKLAGNLFVKFDPLKNINDYFRSKASAEWLYCSKIIEDDEGSMWFGTNAGLFQFSEGIATTFVGENNSMDVPIRNLIGVGKGDILISFANSFGLYHFKDNKINNIKEFNQVYVFSIAKEGEKIWAGSEGDGIFLKKDEKSKFEKQKFLSNKTIYSILPFENNLYLGTDEGLYIIDRDKNVEIFEEITKEKKIYKIKEKDGKIFLGTNEGLIILKGKDSQIINEKDGLKNLFIRSIYVDKNNFVWIGTYGGGLYRYDGKNLFSFPEYLGLPKTIHLILEDKNERLWFSSNQGVFFAKKENLEDFIEGKIRAIDIIGINESDGMLDRECNGGYEPSGFLNEDGFLYLPTIRGIVKINTNFSINYIPPVYIEKISIDGIEKNFEQGKIIFPYGKHFLEIYCASLSYIYPDKCKYKCMLMGWDEDFIDMGRRNVAYYSNLKPGNYKFKVIADNGFGLWNENGAEIEIIVPTPFTHSSYFYLILSIFSITFILLIVSCYTYSLRKRKEKLEKIVEKKTAKIRGLSELASNANIFSSIDELMGFFYENFKEIISYQFVSLLVLEGNILKVVWARFEEKDANLLKDVEIEANETIFSSEKPIILNRINGDNLFFKYLRDENVYSFMVCPLKIMENTFGYILFGNQKENPFSEEDLKEFLDISNHLSSSIRKTYLLEKLQKVEGISEKYYAMVLHDLKHPINTINLYIDLLKEDFDKFDEEQRDYLLSIEKSAKEYNILLGDLLDIALFGGKYLEANMEKRNFVQFLKEISKEMEKRIKSRGFLWDSFIEDSEIKVSFDSKRIKQVIENFLSNALKYAPAGTTITLGLELLESQVKVYLKDEGYITDEKKKIIEEVFSSSYEPKSFISKAGLGLYISKSIIEAHKGRIGFESSREGGSIFYFILPVE